MGKILSLFTGGIYGYLIAAGMAACISCGATYYIVHTANAVTIKQLQLDAKSQQLADTSASLSQLQGFISKMHTAETNYGNTLGAINASIAGLKGSWKNATVKPLPVDCFPDAGRVSSVNAAIHAANNPNPATAP